ncbi:hypothetical protein EFA46_007680 [Halarchaeum sp. CBA1220]|uniref:hypothetical protein n=1 Tax=Halarchaeum sp. CBA1220 TaxID=1853682 RepID=UPI0011CD721B|nr:hypothetical protein [Halarchaeum sp. CBA1220]QLC34088.1 hypothetical protein EFA46_007680 [Halarchaeum sp. CBA1220]
MSTFLISDVHFDDCDVLKEYNRPFETVDEMNQELTKRWNSVVSGSDRVIFGGDLAEAENKKSSGAGSPD